MNVFMPFPVNKRGKLFLATSAMINSFSCVNSQMGPQAARISKENGFCLGIVFLKVCMEILPFIFSDIHVRLTWNMDGTSKNV